VEILGQKKERIKVKKSRDREKRDLGRTEERNLN
jgi:hypothetical protein